jgi:hypothetical protein
MEQTDEPKDLPVAVPIASLRRHQATRTQYPENRTLYNPYPDPFFPVTL